MSILTNDPQAPLQFNGEMPVASRYTFGLAGERFFRTIKDEARILGTHCARCKITYVPPTAFCERCLSECDEWIDVGTVGEIHSFTLLHLDQDGSTLNHPELIAFIRLADGGLIHKIGEISPSEVYIGMKVQAVFRPPHERSGSITDIQYFRPIST